MGIHALPPAEAQGSLSFTEQQELTDDQIQTLLQRAEERLRTKGTENTTTEFKVFDFKLPQLNCDNIPQPPIHISKSVARADVSNLMPNNIKQSGGKIRKVEDPVIVKRRIAEEKKVTGGPKWFNLPRTDLTSEVKRDLQLIQMRSVLDPKRHYKKQTGKAKAPEYSQVGTIIEGPTEFYNARIPKKERKRNLAEEVLAVEAASGRFRKKYKEIQASKTSGKKAYYKALKAKRARNPRRG